MNSSPSYRVSKKLKKEESFHRIYISLSCLQTTYLRTRESLTPYITLKQLKERITRHIKGKRGGPDKRREWMRRQTGPPD